MHLEGLAILWSQFLTPVNGSKKTSRDDSLAPVTGATDVDCDTVTQGLLEHHQSGVEKSCHPLFLLFYNGRERNDGSIK